MTDRFAVLKTHDAIDDIRSGDSDGEWTKLFKAHEDHEDVWGPDATREIVALLERARAEFSSPGDTAIGEEYPCVTWVRDMDSLLARLKEEHG